MRTRVNKKYLRKAYNRLKKQETVIMNSTDLMYNTNLCGLQALSLAILGEPRQAYIYIMKSPEAILLEKIAREMKYDYFSNLNDKGGKEKVLQAYEKALES